MSSVNKAIIVGNLGKDPEARTFTNGGKVVNFTMAASENWTKNGERHERTEWFNVVVKNEKLGEIAERYLRKGSKVYVEGSIQSRKYQDQSGQDRYITEIVVGPFRGEITLLDKKGDGPAAESEAPEREARDDRLRSTGIAMPQASRKTERTFDPHLDDDVPF